MLTKVSRIFEHFELVGFFAAWSIVIALAVYEPSPPVAESPSKEPEATPSESSIAVSQPARPHRYQPIAGEDLKEGG